MKYLFLDFNGTVLDDVDLCLNLLNEMLVLKGLKTVSLKRYKEIFTFPIRTYYDKAGFTYNGYTFEELADYFITEYDKRNLKESFIFADFKEFADGIRGLGYKLVLCSASLYSLLMKQLYDFGIANCFDDVIALDNHHAASKLLLAQDYVKTHDVDLTCSYFVGDTTHDALVGKECGLKVFLIDRGHQASEILEKTGELVYHSFKELLAYFVEKRTL